jgi:hypothetical protein
VNPQTSMSATSNAGPRKPAGCLSRYRLAGSASSASGTRATRATSTGSPTRTSDGFSHQPTTGTTRLSEGPRNSSGSVPSTRTPAGSTPASSSASRSAVPTG